MPKHVDDPCKDGLSAACFAQEPAFAKRAFAFRLLSTFVPPAMSRKLLTFLGLVNFNPAGNLPGGIDLPPWWILIPGAVIPPGWKIGDPPFDGVLVPPFFWDPDNWSYPISDINYIPGYFDAPFNLSGKSIPHTSIWFYDGFTTLDLTTWDLDISGDGDVSISSGELLLFVSTPGDWAGVSRTDTRTPPKNYILDFKLKAIGGASWFFVQFFNGYCRIRFRIDISVMSSKYVSAAGTSVTLRHMIGDTIFYRIYVRQNILNLYVNDVLVLENHDLDEYTSSPGWMESFVDHDATVKFDDFRIIEA